ncbi:hypothetical protein [Chromobacterium violaceum]|uniref:hypothetical protein n=1 Tax=Chromobacterium violaceum TaxID=536 RepID=UPI00111C720D|nr:hypothetical protein [Chromobacterium violaceum]
MVFNFYFFEVPSAFGHATRIKRGIGASDGPNGRYNVYFHSLAMEFSQDSMDVAMEAVDAIAKGECRECELGSGAWLIHVKPTVVEFESADFDELNDGERNVFPFSEFKWALAAWREFLKIPDQSGGVRYEFFLPNDDALDIKSVSSLLKRCN